MATGTGKRINVNASAAGFKPGAASINASDASNRRVRPYMPSNTGGAQKEHSIKGSLFSKGGRMPDQAHKNENWRGYYGAQQSNPAGQIIRR
jgi:hypothetical protein